MLPSNYSVRVTMMAVAVVGRLGRLVDDRGLGGQQHALAVGEPYGIWGGLSESERELLLKRGIRRTT